MSVRLLFRFWFAFEAPVSRAAYLRHGLALMTAKYLGDVGLVWTGAGMWWTPLDYLQSVPFLMSTTFAESAPYLAPLLAAWTLPFMWIGVTMTMRRLLDAGWSAWSSLLFFVPFVNYGLMAVLVFVPSSMRRNTAIAPRPQESRLSSALMSMAAGVALGLGMLVVSVRALNSYGLALFVGTPFAIGTVTAFLLCRRYPASKKETLEVVAMTLLIIGGIAFLLGTEGAICLLMVLPMGLLVALLGAVFGRAMALRTADPTIQAASLFVLLPAAALLESGQIPTEVREVRSAIEVDAPPDVVWRSVVAFPPMEPPKALAFRLGLAYPKRAVIEGDGVGAIRHCIFSTGAFVEPITQWEPGRRLSFDVTSSPPPLRELTFHAGAAPPHLEGYLVARRGEFRLVPLPGERTRLEGSTWYEQRLRPEGYWVLFSDPIIRAIHRSVLEHVKRNAEAAYGVSHFIEEEDASVSGAF